MGRAKALLILLALTATAPAAPAQDASAPARGVKTPSRHNTETLAGTRSRNVGLMPGSQGWWLGTAFMVVVLGGAAVLCIAAKRQAEAGASVRLQVVGRVCLPPKHAVFAVRAGGRTLLIGTGPQGSPALLGELEDDEPSDPPSLARVDGASAIGPRRGAPAGRFDVRIGDES